MRASFWGGGAALSRLKLRARLMMRGKGDIIERDKTLIGKEKEHVSNYKGLLSEVKMGNF